jgi:hypothetical protein
MKPVESLTIRDLVQHPVWRYADADDRGESIVRPVLKYPVSSLQGKLVGVQVRLPNAARVWAIIGNVDANNARLNEHFVTISLFHTDRWLRLARYHDQDYADSGPPALAQTIGLHVDDLFPIAYDIRQYAKGDAAALAGQILKNPRERLSRAEIIALAVP